MEEILEYSPSPAMQGTLDALLVSGGKISRIRLRDDNDDGGDDIHRLIGNYFGTCFTVSSSHGLITGYCDDEFLLRTRQEIFENWNVVLEPGTLYDGAQAIGGPIVICGVGPDGETRSLEGSEMKRFWLDDKYGLVVDDGDSRHRAIPCLRYLRYSANDEVEALDSLPL